MPHLASLPSQRRTHDTLAFVLADDPHAVRATVNAAAITNLIGRIGARGVGIFSIFTQPEGL